MDFSDVAQDFHDYGDDFYDFGQDFAMISMISVKILMVFGRIWLMQDCLLSLILARICLILKILDRMERKSRILLETNIKEFQSCTAIEKITVTTIKLINSCFTPSKYPKTL